MNYRKWPSLGLALPADRALRIGDALYLDSIQDSQISSAAETIGQLSDSGYLIESGSFKINGDATGKWIECISAGTLCRRAYGAYGTWDFDLDKASNGHDFSTRFIAGNRAEEAMPSTPDDGYMLYLQAVNRVTLRETGTGYLFYSAQSYINSPGRYQYKITRSATGEFAVYIRDWGDVDWGLVIADSGSNPVTDTTVQDALYVVFGLGAGDKIYLDQHHMGVISP